MMKISSFLNCLQNYLDNIEIIDFVPLLLLRIYLAPIFWMAGREKWRYMTDTITWFGNADWGLGLPFPEVMAYLATVTELIGALCLLAGFAVRWASIPLLITMLIAAFKVHWINGWHVIAQGSSEASRRLMLFMDWLEGAHPQRHEHITLLGDPVILNNGVEFAATYFVMLLVLFCFGGGKYISMDYWIETSIQVLKPQFPTEIAAVSIKKN